jgi:hypothetical protein
VIKQEAVRSVRTGLARFREPASLERRIYELLARSAYMLGRDEDYVSGGARPFYAAPAGVGRMTAPMIQKIGTKMPKKNIHPCPFLSVITPRVTSKARYSKPPKPMPHHMFFS